MKLEIHQTPFIMFHAGCVEKVYKHLSNYCNNLLIHVK